LYSNRTDLYKGYDHTSNWLDSKLEKAPVLCYCLAGPTFEKERNRECERERERERERRKVSAYVCEWERECLKVTV